MLEKPHGERKGGIESNQNQNSNPESNFGSTKIKVDERWYLKPQGNRPHPRLSRRSLLIGALVGSIFLTREQILPYLDPILPGGYERIGERLLKDNREPLQSFKVRADPEVIENNGVNVRLEPSTDPYDSAPIDILAPGKCIEGKFYKAGVDPYTGLHYGEKGQPPPWVVINYKGRARFVVAAHLDIVPTCESK